MTKLHYRISIHSSNIAQANKYAAELRDFIDAQNLDEEIALSVDKNQVRNQDLGTVVVAILSTTAIGSLAKGVQSWLAKRNTASIEIKDQNGHIVVKNIGAKDAAKLVEKLQHSEKNDG